MSGIVAESSTRRISTGGSGTGRFFKRLEVGAQRLGQPHDEIEAPVALEHQAGLAAADGGGDHVLDVRQLRP